MVKCMMTQLTNVFSERNVYKNVCFYFWFLWFSFEQSLAEATKIAKIREELEKLDQELAADVEILRKEIEAVTLQYTTTR